MLNLNRRDRVADPADTVKPGLKPAVYESPLAASPALGTTARPGAPIDVGNSRATAPVPGALSATTSATSTKASADAPESKLFVGVNIKLKGVEITDCDALVIEGEVEATVHSKAMEIAGPGTLKGHAEIDVAEVHGEFVGELTARSRLVVHGTGRVSGTIRYGKLIVEEGGELTGDVKRLDAGPGEGAATGGAVRSSI
ncbi:MAG: polymer-forming cytoskeletal protein [Burkholderiales bacterium]|nr:polymer-forming cytoskeletal protein [Burkholderiales bacterium]